MHLCCLGYFVVVSLGGYRKVCPAFACQYCHVWGAPESESGGLHNCKMAKGFLPGNKCTAHSSEASGRLWKPLSGEKLTLAKRPGYFFVGFSMARVIGLKYMWDHKGDLPFCNARSSGKLRDGRKGHSTPLALRHKGFLCKSFPVLP